VADLFDSEPSEKSALEGVCVVYIMYFDEEQGHVPLLIYPDDTLKNNKKFMRPIKYHSIWFLAVDEEEALDHIDLEYKGYTYFGKKFRTKSKRKKRRAGLEEETPETIVIIISLPTDLDIFGDELIYTMTEKIRENFKDQLFEVIEGEIVKDAIIKTPKIKECIEKGTRIKVFLRELIEKTTKEFFKKVVKKQSDAISIKKQKAISYISLKGFDFSHIGDIKTEDAFSNIKIFDPNKNNEEILAVKPPIQISSINLIEDSQEIEITVQNNTNKELVNLNIRMTHVKEFFEKEIMFQKLDFWYPGEELLFISPIIPHINEYLFFIIEDNNDKKRLISTKIDLNTLNKIKG